VYYSNVIDEHITTRERAGLFDICHMGELFIEGKDAFSFTQAVITNDLYLLEDGKAFYTMMCRDDGGVIDDLFVYRIDANKYMLVVNAANIRKDFDWIAHHKGSFDVSVSFKISNNVCEIKNNTTYYEYGIYKYTLSSSATYKIWNNVIYGVVDTDNNSGSGMYLAAVSPVAENTYVYNNTVVGSYYGIAKSGGTCISKNNIAYNNTIDYSGTFDSSSTNNLSKDATAPPYNTYYTNTSVIFADETNQDFHLDSADTAARNQGAILYDSGDDANLNFTTDIDNNARLDSAGTWDIGADEGITKVYRSVGPSATAAIATGATYGNVEVKPVYVSGSTTNIADYVATFWSDLPINVGVGDALQYDDDDDGDIDASDSIVFITKRIDASHFSVRTASGTAPASTLAPDSNWSIFRSYTSLFNAEAGDENDSIDDDLEAFESWSGGKDLQTSQEQWNIAAYAGQGGVADTVAVAIDGWTTTADSYIKVYTPTRSDEVGVSQRHSGVWDATKYNLSTGTGVASVDLRENYTVFDGLQITNSGTASTDNDILVAGYISFTNVKNSIIKGGYNGIYHSVSNIIYGGNKFYGNIIYETYYSGIRIYLSGATPLSSYVYNNTVYNCNASNTAWRGGIETLNADVVKNNISMENGNLDFVNANGQSYKALLVKLFLISLLFPPQAEARICIFRRPRLPRILAPTFPTTHTYHSIPTLIPLACEKISNQEYPMAGMILATQDPKEQTGISVRMSLLRKFTEASRRMRTGLWKRSPPVQATQ
ncbi:MAG: Aminomethyltransferase, partial [Candidatus Moranbacteria bacterium GW2011_GWF2_37_11]